MLSSQYPESRVSIPQLFAILNRERRKAGMRWRDLLDASGVEQLTSLRALRTRAATPECLWVILEMLHYLGFSWEQIVTIENPTPSAVFDAINTSLRGTFPNHPSALAAKIARARLGSKCTLEQAAELSRTTARELIGYESGERDTEGMPIAVLCGYARRANVGVGELLELKPISSQSDPDLWDLAFEEVIEQIASQLAHQRVKVDIRLFRKLIPIAHADYMGYLTEKHPSRGTLNRGGEIRVGPKWIDSLLLRAEGSSET